MQALTDMQTSTEQLFVCCVARAYLPPLCFYVTEQREVLVSDRD